MPIRPLALALFLSLPVAAQAQERCPPGSIGCDVLGGILGDLMRRVDPWLADLAEMLGDLSGWHTPEVLENGDILIRRRQPAPETAPEEPDAPVTTPLEL